jgi:hypothetical protein
MAVPKVAPDKWRSRIVDHGKANPKTLAAHPLNWRVHPIGQQAALAGAIGDIGFIRSVLVNKRTGRIIDGHLRVALAIRSKVTEIDVEYVDLSEEEEAEALATLDPLAAAAESDPVALQNLLQGMGTSDAALAALLSQLAEDAGIPGLSEEATHATPVEFTAYDQTIATDFQCPKCGYEWSGKANGHKGNEGAT